MGLRLGWRWSRPNDLSGPDERPVRDAFMELQRFMTWPHAGVTLTGPVTATYSDRTLTAINAPLGLNAYNLVRNNTIQVPRDFDSWFAVGAVAAAITGSTTGTYQIGWRLNGATTTWRQAENVGVAANPITIVCPYLHPVRKGDFLSIAASAPAPDKAFSETSEAYIFFLPLA